MSGSFIRNEEEVVFFSTKLFSVTKSTLEKSLKEIEKELEERIYFFEKRGMNKEAKRIE